MTKTSGLGGLADAGGPGSPSALLDPTPPGCRGNLCNIHPVRLLLSVQILKDVVPGLSRVAVMWNSANTGVVPYYRQVQAAALGVTLQPVVEVAKRNGTRSGGEHMTALEPKSSHAGTIVNAGCGGALPRSRQCHLATHPARRPE
jgi:hypothetical protein